MLILNTAAPAFTQEPSDVARNIGSNVTLSCHVQGYPEPQVTWRRQDGSALSNRPHTHSIITQNRGELRITSEFHSYILYRLKWTQCMVHIMTHSFTL